LTASARAAQGVLTIDLDALVANWRQLALRAAPAECAAVVKADGYGLGAARVAAALAAAGCRTFFVATLDEGTAVRAALAPLPPAGGEEAVIYLLNGLPRGAEPDLIAHRLRPVLNSLADIDAWAAVPGGPLPAAVQLDTGMSRLGLSDEEQRRLAEAPQRLGGIALALLMSHLACADEPDHPLNDEQRRRFAALTARLPPCRRSLANSSGIFLGNDFHHQLVRPGAALYGVAPNAREPNPLQGVIRLDGRIVQVREIDSPRTVGYGATHRVAGPTRIATVSVGYADGFLRSLSNRGRGHIGGYAVPLVGRVSMDLTTFDVSEVPPALLAQGGTIELIGPHQPVDAVAAAAGTIGYEILTALGRRYHRVYVGSAAGADGSRPSC
jgi:alanine racemase